MHSSLYRQLTRQPSAVDRPCVGRAVTWSMELNHWIEEHVKWNMYLSDPLVLQTLVLGKTFVASSRHWCEVSQGIVKKVST